MAVDAAFGVAAVLTLGVAVSGVALGGLVADSALAATVSAWAAAVMALAALFIARSVADIVTAEDLVVLAAAVTIAGAPLESPALFDPLGSVLAGIRRSAA